MKDYILNSPPVVPLENNFATNINPLGPPEWVLNYMRDNSEIFLTYPQLWHQKCDQNTALALGVNPEFHVAISGTSQFFASLPFFLHEEKKRTNSKNGRLFRLHFGSTP